MRLPSFFKQLAAVVLGHERKQQLRVSRSLTAAYVFLICVALQIYSSYLGFMQTEDAWRLSAVIVVNICIWYGLLRSGLGAQLNAMRVRLQDQKNELAQALTRIQVLATRDELTGLFNRRHMLEVLTQHQKRLERSGHHRFCLALLDIDHFKRINDTHGHYVGDEVLREFAATLQSSLRDTDVLARWGGEEFLLLINDTAPEQANFGLDRARELLAAKPLLSHMPDLKVTFSAGLTSYDDDEELSQCIERADKALYQAKRTGRNRTVVDDHRAASLGSSLGQI